MQTPAFNLFIKRWMSRLFVKSSMRRSERINQSYGGYVVSLTIVTLLPASNLVTNTNETNTVDRYTKEQKRLNEPELLWCKRY